MQKLYSELIWRLLFIPDTSGISYPMPQGTHTLITYGPPWTFQGWWTGNQLSSGEMAPLACWTACKQRLCTCDNEALLNILTLDRNASLIRLKEKLITLILSSTQTSIVFLCLCLSNAASHSLSSFITVVLFCLFPLGSFLIFAWLHPHLPGRALGSFSHYLPRHLIQSLRSQQSAAPTRSPLPNYPVMFYLLLGNLATKQQGTRGTNEGNSKLVDKKMQPYAHQ